VPIDSSEHLFYNRSSFNASLETPIRRAIMERGERFALVFRQLRSMLEPFAERLIVTADSADSYMLDTAYVEQWKKPLFFGGAQIKKHYVSYHLMPVYAFPDLLDGISPQLKKRMQGKSCFNFTTLDPALSQELAELTARGFERFARELGI
jgi:hypothetical protein